jgi:hypothetical protein
MSSFVEVKDLLLKIVFERGGIPRFIFCPIYPVYDWGISYRYIVQVLFLCLPS